MSYDEFVLAMALPLATGTGLLKPLSCDDEDDDDELRRFTSTDFTDSDTLEGFEEWFDSHEHDQAFSFTLFDGDFSLRARSLSLYIESAEVPM